jgi:hypothetical protein
VSHLKVTHAGPGQQRVELDGQDVGSALAGLTLRYDAGSLPVATMNVVIHRGDVDADDVRVGMPDATFKLLVQLGWTPLADTHTSKDRS